MRGTNTSTSTSYSFSLYLGVPFSTFRAAQGIGTEWHKSRTTRHTAALTGTSGTSRHKPYVKRRMGAYGHT